MPTFKVYPKKGEIFTVQFDRFELKEKRFVLYNDVGREVSDNEGFLSFDNVAAILPDKQTAKGRIRFLIYLKGQRGEPHSELPAFLEVYADAFEIGPNISFKWQQKDMLGKLFKEGSIEGIYIALSEVVAIMPSDGLVSRD
jgi:hypothetical protein